MALFKLTYDVHAETTEQALAVLRHLVCTHQPPNHIDVVKDIPRYNFMERVVKNEPLKELPNPDQVPEQGELPVGEKPEKFKRPNKSKPKTPDESKRGKDWVFNDIKKVYKLYNQGKDYEEIALAVKRTPDGVRKIVSFFTVPEDHWKIIVKRERRSGFFTAMIDYFRRDAKGIEQPPFDENKELYKHVKRKLSK